MGMREDEVAVLLGELTYMCAPTCTPSACSQTDSVWCDVDGAHRCVIPHVASLSVLDLHRRGNRGARLTGDD